MLDYIIIGKRIKEIRLQKPLTQEKLAEMCNLSASYISLIESGKDRHASLKALVSIGNNLGVTVDTFLKGYQKNDVITYNTDFSLLFEDCSCYESQVIYDVAVAAKRSIRNNNQLDYMSKT